MGCGGLGLNVGLWMGCVGLECGILKIKVGIIRSDQIRSHQIGREKGKLRRYEIEIRVLELSNPGILVMRLGRLLLLLLLMGQEIYRLEKIRWLVRSYI